MNREKKPYMIFTFSTTTAAMFMEKVCGSRGIPGRLIPVPREITAGCGLAWRMTMQEYEQYKDTVCTLHVSVEQRVQLEL